jgi:hypothetical protein
MARKTEFAGQSNFAADNCRRPMIAGFSFRLSSDSGAFTCVPNTRFRVQLAT